MLAPVNFVVETPCRDEVPGNIEHALSLGLPEADAEPLKRLTIIANGPSAKDAPLDGETVALNGALKLFFNTGRVPTYWAACDPQRDYVLEFLDVPLSKETIYYVGTKCHPDVFKRLEGYDVRLWHISDYPAPKPIRAVPTGCSVTLVALGLFRRLGYRAFDVWGWDGCYVDGEHHAAPTADYSTENDLSVTIGATQISYPRTLDGVEAHRWKTMKGIAKKLGLDVPEPLETKTEGGRVFQTTKTWTLEAQDAVTMLSFADYAPDVTVHGDGMIKALLLDTKLIRG